VRLMTNMFRSVALVVWASATLHAQTPDPSSYFPSSVGDVWEYDTEGGFARYVIAMDSIGSDGSRYIFYAPGTRPMYKIDTAHYVFYLPSSLNWAVYKLDANLGDSWVVHPGKLDSPGARPRRQARVEDFYQTLVFGEIRYVKTVAYYALPIGDTTITVNADCERTILIVNGIGEFYEHYTEGGPQKYLRGCIIDGVTIGLISAVDLTPPEVPTNCRLYRNYPNPFNSSTTISFSLNSPSFVTLTIHDFLGRRVDNLLNAQMTTGVHSARWEAIGFASGLYYCTLRVGGKTYSNRLILLK
jgi:hypothetical protein